MLEHQYYNFACSDAYDLAMYIADGEDIYAGNFCTYKNIATVEVRDLETGDLLWGYDEGTSSDKCFKYHIEIECYSYNGVLCNYDVSIEIPELPDQADDEYYMFYHLVSLAYVLKYWIYFILLAAGIIAVFAFVFLMRAVGYRDGAEVAGPSWDTKFPFDLQTILTGLGVIFGIILMGELINENALALVACLGILLLCEMIVIYWCMGLALRIKVKMLWKYTVIYHLWKLAVKIVRGIQRVMKKILEVIPFVWQIVLFFVIITGVEAMGIALAWWEMDNLVILWMIEKILLIPVVVTVLIAIGKLRKGAKILASGNLSYKIDTTGMYGDMKQHGQNLNQIAEGMGRAVDARMKSERMKTELITNVSHDIKTPLTSIINYSDLICKENTENEKITEYAEVLHRQSERLKRLIEDLVEASKASTGNLEIALAPCDACVFIEQAEGEYMEKLKDANLELITGVPDHPVRIMADGRRMWRIFDNLMSNICKYAQPGTRVYLTLEHKVNYVFVTFKNISSARLNINANELLERFVRADASRTTEGNGLGLSIAKSLTELQHGGFDISVDGDLFKITLAFPVIKDGQAGSKTPARPDPVSQTSF